MPFVYNDGGRLAAGFKGNKAGDCVVRAIAIATDQPYQIVYDAISAIARSGRQTKHMRRKSSARDGVYTGRQAFKRYMQSLGWHWTPTMQIGQGCKVHLVAGELPPGRLIVSVSRHWTTVIDGVVYDTHDPQRTTYWYRLGTTEVERTTERCVYGYWSKP